MPNYLIEIGTEELPPDYVSDAQERLKELMAGELEASNLSHGDIKVYGTPRRLACVVKDLAAVQPTVDKSVKGPPVKAGFDKEGKPLPPATGFAKKHGLTAADLEKKEVQGVEYLFANLTVAGMEAKQVLADLVPAVIDKISGERLMRWGSSDLKFSRPVRWLVSIFDNEEVPVSIDSISSGRKSAGHRILAPDFVEVKSPDSYVEDLKKAFVLVDSGERRKKIEEEVGKVAGSVDGRPRKLNTELLDEVVNITEWPKAVLGEFAADYLELPDNLIETVMVHHQRYFPVERQSGESLLPYFVSVANNDRQEARETIKRGNERVLRARLADGKFFYFDDQKTKLSDRKESLGQLTFHEGLGSYLDKQSRMVEVAAKALKDLNLEPKISVCLERALELCKLDLVTNLVGELPELQGYVGSWYAAAEGEPPEISTAIASHYSPRSSHDSIPQDTTGQLAAVIDKLDNLVGLFCEGRRPKGSSDPYVMRRQAQGAIDILIDGLTDIPVDVTRLLDVTRQAYEPFFSPGRKKTNPEKGLADLSEFLIQRLRFKLADMNFSREVIDAVLAAGDPLANLPDVITRLKVLSELVADQKGLELVRAGVRVSNILGSDSRAEVDPKLFVSEAESILWNTFNKEVVDVWETDGFKCPSSLSEYKELLKLLKKIGSPVDKLFDDVMINDPDEAKRANRHGLLMRLDRYFKTVAEFAKLQPLLP